MKPGYKTTEFWLAGAATVVGGLMASGVIAEESSLAKILGIAASALVALGYTGARLALKKKEG
jgi:hypothetical protein